MKNSFILFLLAFLSSSCLNAMDPDIENYYPKKHVKTKESYINSSSYLKMMEDEDIENYYPKKQVKKELFYKHKGTREVSKEDQASEYYELGTKAIENKSYSDAVYYLDLAARLRHVDARYNLGVLYEFGRGTEMNLKKASECYSAAIGHEKAHEALSRVINKQRKLVKQGFFPYIIKWLEGSEDVDI